MKAITIQQDNRLIIMVIMFLLLGIAITLTPRISKPTVGKIVREILTKHTGEVVLLVGNGSGNLRLLHHRLGGTGEGPHQYGDLYIYTIPDQGPVIVVKSRYGS